MALSAEDLQRAAMACRVAADQARRDVERQENPQTKAIFEKMAAEYIKLAERFERARQSKLANV
jgi:hypothetical protein